MTNGSSTKHEQIRETLLARIRELGWHARLPSERDLAESFDVSRGTINKVMGELERGGYISRRVGRGAFVLPRDKAVYTAAAPLVRARVVLAFEDYFSYTIWRRVHAAEMVALRENVSLTSFKFQQSRVLDPLLEFLDEQEGIDGVILAAPQNAHKPEMMRRLDAYGKPVVIVGSGGPVNLYHNLFDVSPDYLKSGYLKLATLLEHGHRDIAYLSNETQSHGTLLAREGMKRALYERGLKWGDLIRREDGPGSTASTLVRGHQLTRELLREHLPTAILYDTFQGAFGGMRALCEAGLRIPADVSIVCSQDHFGYEAMTWPALTTVVEDSEAMMRTAIQIILHPEPRDQKMRTVDMELQLRESVRRL